MSSARTERRLRQHMRNEARWLQKTTFALGKARDARERIGDIRSDDMAPLIDLGDGDVTIDELQELIDRRIEEVRTTLGAGPYRSI